MPTATLTSKGQVTIPSSVRKRMRLKPGDRLDFIFAPGGEIKLKTKRAPFERLRGIAKTPGARPVNVREMDQGIARALQLRWERVSRRTGR